MDTIEPIASAFGTRDGDAAEKALPIKHRAEKTIKITPVIKEIMEEKASVTAVTSKPASALPIAYQTMYVYHRYAVAHYSSLELADFNARGQVGIYAKRKALLTGNQLCENIHVQRYLD
jgi:hypothetical protein